MLSSQLSSIMVFVDFAMNQDYIAKELCEKKNVVKSDCNGKCYIAKQLKAQQEQDQNKQSSHTFQKVEVLFFHDSLNEDLNFNVISFLSSKTYTYIKRIYFEEIIDRIFHPPK